jgi:two-component system, chemotaxis family, CheB/CheR fusion protein
MSDELAPAGRRPRTHPRLEAAWESSPVPQLIVDPEGILAAVNGRARALLRLQRSDVGRPVADLAVLHQPMELGAWVQKALEGGATVEAPAVEWPIGDEGALVRLAFAVAPISNDAGEVSGMQITVHDVTEERRLQEELGLANSRLETVYEELQSTNEELGTTNEELRSTIEELETTNEELQSTNEEMSSIIELMRSRGRQLDDANGYLQSILASLRPGVVVVDRDMVVRVWNRRAEDLWGLRADEVEGESFLTLDIGLPVGELRRPIQAVLATRGADGEVTLDAVDRRGRRFRCRVGIAPLSAEDAVHGAVLLMENAAE